jgi:hypothetical protein
LKRLKARNFKLIESDNSKAIKQDYKETNDTFGSWITDNYQIDYSEFPVPITATQILAEYRKWYQENVSERSLNMATKTIGGRIKDLYRVDYVTTYVAGKRVCGYNLKKKQHDDDIGGLGEFISPEVPVQTSMAANSW